MITVADIRKMIRDEAPSRLDIGTVIATDMRGTYSIAVRLSGGKVCSQVLTCYPNLQVGDFV